MDAYYRSNPSLIVTKDPDAISRKRPLKYIDHETQVVEKMAAGLSYPSDGIVNHVERLDEETGKN
jgi:hypothetical protein